MAMTLVSTVTVGSGGAASITLDNIPQTGKDLLILTSLRGTTQNIVRINFNGTSGSTNWTGIALRGSTGVDSTTGDANFSRELNASGTTANTFGSGSWYVTNYTSSTNKSVSNDAVAEDNANSFDAMKAISAMLWSQTAAITSVTLTPFGGNFAQHSTASLYIIS
jgi:hypothetical protein